MAFNYTVNLSDPNLLSGSSDSLLVANLDAALNDWSQYISGIGTLVVQLDIVASSGTANGGSTGVLSTHTTLGSGQEVELSSVYELTTGLHAPGTASDITISIDPNFVNGTLFLSPNPEDHTTEPNRINAVSVFSHELAHGFGMQGYYSQDGTLLNGGSFETSFDSYIKNEPDGSASFTGPAAEAVYGGPVPLTTHTATGENYYHFANSIGDPLGTDLMSGIGIPFGFTAISNLDLAVLADVGVPLAPKFSVDDTTTNVATTAAGDFYTGPVAGLEQQYINLSTDNLAITASVPNSFIHSGSGTDAIDVSKVGGTNVLDGSTGSNFLVGGSGSDTFFVDDRAAPAVIWSTVVNFHAGDAATVWGVTQQGFNLNWIDNQGAAGFTGLTLGATASGIPNANLTLTGFTSADLQNGRLTVAFGTDTASGSNYMLVQGH
jgi:hypothetical protein